MSAKSQRILKIYLLLKSRPITIDYLRQWAAHHSIEISERTFYRDLQVLEDSVLSPDEHIVVSVGEINKKTFSIFAPDIYGK